MTFTGLRPGEAAFTTAVTVPVGTSDVPVLIINRRIQ